MSKLPFVVVCVVAALALGMPTPAPATSPVLVAVDRCNGQTIDDQAGRVNGYARHGPGNGNAEVMQRFAALAEVISILNEEREILSSVCSNQAQRDAFFARIAATQASALVLEAEIAERLNASCPAAQRGLPQMMLADAWLALANVINQGNGSVPAAFADVAPKIKANAAAVGLTLPSWPDTSQYWRDQVHAKAKAAIATCPSPSPVPTPT